MKKFIWTVFVCVVIICKAGLSQNPGAVLPDYQEKLWVDSVFKTLTPDERIAQLISIRALPVMDTAAIDSIFRIIRQYNIGGVTFFRGGPVAQAKIVNQWQSKAKTPLLISIDGEWGIAMRLDSVLPFPRQMTLGAIKDDKLVYEMGKAVAHQCRLTGVNLNFAPVVDVNHNPANPVINMRSFGEDRENVAMKGLAYIKGMQDNGVLACAKHFPGHGDTDADSHYTLPVLKHSASKIDSIDLYPFRQLFNAGVAGVMTAHLYIPALDSTPNTATSLSKPVVTGLLHDSLRYNGLVITDALEMKGVSAYFPEGQLEVMALQAGNDILLLPESVPLTISSIRTAIEKGLLKQDDIDAKCRKVLAYKYRAGLNNFQPLETEGLYEKLNSANAKLLKKRIFASALTLVKNNRGILPLKNTPSRKIATVTLGDTTIHSFQENIGLYADVDHFSLSKSPTKKQVSLLLYKLSSYDLAIIGINNTTVQAVKDFGVPESSIDFINALRMNKKIILVIFGNPYMLERLQGTQNIEALLVAYQDHSTAEIAAAEALFGAIPINGRLPVTGSSEFPVNTGIDISPLNILHTVCPEEIGINSRDLALVDSIAIEGLSKRAYPGCQILAAKDGKIFYHKSFGFHTYENSRPVKNTDIYDLASVTKLAATTLAVMKLYEQGEINLDKRIGKYASALDRSDKAHLKIRDILAHQSGLQAWIPFYVRTLENGIPKPSVYSKKQSDDFPCRVADSLYIRKSYCDTMLQEIIGSKLKPEQKYLYSDIGFYLMKMLIEEVSGKTLGKYVDENFYKPLGLATMGYNPRKRFGLNRIAPTELDTVFRKQLIHGDVHDQGAAMIGGVGGHAGVFSNAFDLAVIMQMLLQGGEYNGTRYFLPETVKEFTRVQFVGNENRRGLGFDKPLLNGEDNGPTCLKTSPESFGHTGFTGAYTWADPKNGLVYVFLANRVNPDASNNQLVTLNIRTRIQEVLYKALEKTTEN